MDVSITQEELENVAKIYDRIRALYRKKIPELDTSIAEDFEKHVKTIMTEYSQRLVAQEDLQQSGEVEALSYITKNRLYNLCVDKAIELVGAYDQKLSVVIEQVMKEKENVFSSVTQAYFQVCDLEKLKNEELERAKKETADVLEAAEALEKELNDMRAERDQLKTLSEAVPATSNEQIEALQEENRRYLDKIIQMSKQNATQAVKTPAERPSFPGSAKMRPATAAARPLSQRQPSIRNLTQKQMRDLIEEIYASKTKFDQKCAENKQPRETMEQHVYSFLNQKYGLASLVQEWANSIFAGVQKYQATDNDIAVFAKIVSHEIDEEFRFVQAQLKTTAAEILKMEIKAKYPYKSESVVNKLFNDKIAGELDTDDWEGIVSYMYNESDAQIIQEEVRNRITQKQERIEFQAKRIPRAKNSSLRVKAGVTYNELLQILLEFQLSGHERFLSPFIKNFRSIDSDCNGIVNEDEFRKLCASINLLESTEDYLSTIDPYGNDSITLSDCISLFNTEQMVDARTSVLQYLAAYAEG